MKTTVAAIDFGTSKIVTLVAENSGSQRCDIVGAGIAEYDGYMLDGWNDPANVTEKIQQSIAEAEKQSHRRLREINVGVPGAFTRVDVTEVRIPLTGPDPKVTPADVKNIFDQAAKKLGSQPGGIVIHSSPAWFMVDNHKKTLEPVGMKGRELSALISFVSAEKFFVDEVNGRLNSLGIAASGFYSAPAGEAMLYLPEEDRDRTAVLIDMGYLNTEVMIVEGDAIIYHKVIEMGGGNIAADLSIGLGVNINAAEEKIKQQYVFNSVVAQENSFTIPGVDGQKPMTFTREQVQQIIEPRVEEIAEAIQAALEDSGVQLGNWSNIYLTGGGLAFNRGGRDFLSKQLSRTVRDTPKRTTKMTSHAFSSTLGLMDLIIDTIEQNRQPSGGVGGGVMNFFRSLLGG